MSHPRVDTTAKTVTKPPNTKSQSFTLLLTNNVNCSKCLSYSVYILIGRENEFIGFFCQEHGEKLHKRLESKYQFESENKGNKDKSKEVNCANCNKPFKKKEASHKYCKPKCREEAWKKRHPEKEKERKKYRIKESIIREFCKRCKKVFIINKKNNTICEDCLKEVGRINKLIASYSLTLPKISKEFIDSMDNPHIES